MAGEEQDFLQAEEYFQATATDPERGFEEVREACCVVARAARLRGDERTFFKYVMKVIADDEGGCSEACLELGLFYEQLGDPEEAVIWFYNAAYEVTPQLALISGRQWPLEGLVRCYRALGMEEQALQYEEEVRKLQ